jgi:hypothetical protein
VKKFKNLKKALVKIFNILHVVLDSAQIFYDYSLHLKLLITSSRRTRLKKQHPPVHHEGWMVGAGSPWSLASSKRPRKMVISYN